MIRIIAIGKMKERAHREIIAEFSKRMKSVHKLELLELKAASSRMSIDSMINDESQRILEKIHEQDFVILLDLRGKEYDSESFSKILMRTIAQTPRVCFVIGGSHGVSQAVFDRANLRWKLSALTFPHQFVRFLLYEQIYRAFMIEQNHPYHK